MFTLAVTRGWSIQQIDINNAFLNGDLQQSVFMSQPEGYEHPHHTGHVCKLVKALYGLKQAPKAWFDKLKGFLLSIGFQNSFTRGKVDTTLFVFEKGQDCLLVQIYVDDIIFVATNESLCKKFSKLMQDEFEMSMMGELNFFLGLQIKKCQECFYIHIQKCTKELLKKFDIEEGRTVSTPMATNVKIDKDEKGKPVDEFKYRGMIGSLLYLTTSRPDILHAICLCARFQINPKESHMSAVKRIFRYLKGTIQYGLFYPKNEKNENYSLKGYSDSDYAGNIDDRKSTSGSCQFLGDCLVSWFSKKQNCVSLSTVEAEYISAAFCCTQLLWMKQTLADYKCSFESNVPIFCDNISAINIAQNPVHHNRTKHIEIRHHFLRDCVSKRKIEISFVPSQDQLADIFTKPLSSETFASIRARLGIMHIE
ncbi:hypothetical protein DH2020_019303 [Rehmannia glutinosa]|uniref:Reverse transcriptase Ty1/copia-type domain-containing protein n=1 Tax=Rehmannia glutinosa TaxID=99300 RepID=A0ABR0WN81_REHGL